MGLSVLKLRELSRAGELFDSYSSSGDDEDSGTLLFTLSAVCLQC